MCVSGKLRELTTRGEQTKGDHAGTRGAHDPGDLNCRVSESRQCQFKEYSKCVRDHEKRYQHIAIRLLDESAK